MPDDRFAAARHRRVVFIAVVAFYLVLGVITTGPALLHPTHLLAGNLLSDAGGNAGTLDSWRRTVLAGHPGWDPTLAPPLGTHWDQIPRSPLSFAVLTGLGILLGGAAAYNLLVLLSYPGAALSAYVLGRALQLSPAAALLCGSLYGFSTYHFTQEVTGRPALVHTEFFPLLVLAALNWTQKRRRRDLGLLALVLALTLLWDYYYGFFGILVVGAYFVVSATHRWRTLAWRDGLRELMAGVAATELAIVLAAPFLVLSNLGFNFRLLSDRAVNEYLSYSLQPCELLLPRPTHPILGRLGCAPGLPPSELAVFLGWVDLALTLGAVGLLVRRRLVLRRPHGALALTLVGVGLAWALPAAWEAAGLPSPGGLTAALLPALRVTVRAVVLSGLGLALLAAAALGSLRWRPRPLAVLAVTLALLGWAESAGVGPVGDTAAPAAYHWLSQLPAGTRIAQYPMTSGDTAVFYAHLLWHDQYPLPDVGLALLATPGDDVRTELANRSPELPGELAGLRVGYVMSHRDPRGPGGGTDVLAGLDGLRPVHRDGDYTVWQVTAAAAPLVYLAGPFQAAVASADGYSRLLHGSSGEVVLDNPGGPLTGVLLLEAICAQPTCPDRFAYRAPGGSGEATRRDGVARVEIPLRLPTGVTRVALTEDPAPGPRGPGYLLFSRPRFVASGVST